MKRRFVRNDGIIEDLKDHKLFTIKEVAYIHIMNVLYNELQDIKKRLDNNEKEEWK